MRPPDDAAVEDDAALPDLEDVKKAVHGFWILDQIQDAGAEKSAREQPDGELVHRIWIDVHALGSPGGDQKSAKPAQSHEKAETVDWKG